jgi:hypothetical protein
MTPKQAARILLRSRQALLLASFALSAFWAWRDSGLFRVLAELEIRWANRYDSFFTLLFTFLTLFVASMLLGSVLTNLMRRQFSKDEWQELLHDTTALLDTPVDFSRRIAWWVFVVLVGLPAIAFCGTGAYFLWSGYQGSLLEVTGRARPGLVLDVTSSRPTGPSTSYGFIPLFEDPSRIDVPVRVVVKAFGDVSERLMKDAGEGRNVRARGVRHAGLDGYARQRLAADGVALDADVFTLDTTESPADAVRFGWTLAAAGVVLQLLVLGGLWWATGSKRTLG